MTRDIRKIVDEVLERSPLPEDYRDLVPAQRRRIEREAAERQMTPEAYWASLRAEAYARESTKNR